MGAAARRVWVSAGPTSLGSQGGTSHRFALLFLTADLFGQSPLSTGDNSYGPVVARNKTGTTDFVWVSYSDWSSILYKRNETPCCSNTSPTTLGSGVSPECDVDDDTSITGQYNSAVVWVDTDNRIWLSINAGTAIQVGQKSDNTYILGDHPRVALARTGGKLVVTWHGGNSGITGQLYQIGSGSSVSRYSYPFDIAASGPNGGFRNYAVSCADNGNFVADYLRLPGSGFGPATGTIVKGFVMPSSFGNPSVNFGEVQVNSSTWYGGSDVAVYYDGSFVVAWKDGAPAARRYSASGSVISNTDVAISGGCGYYHPCGSTDGTAYGQDPYNVSVACQRCTPGNYVVSYHGKRSTDSYETFRLKICADVNRTHCSEDVLVIGAADSYPEPDIYKWARVGMDDCGRMVMTFPGKEFHSSLAIYSYFEALCDSCDTSCRTELVPCLAIPVPDCAHGLAALRSKPTKPTATASTFALAPVPIDKLGAKPSSAAPKPATKSKAARLEPKPSLTNKPATN